MARNYSTKATLFKSLYKVIQEEERKKERENTYSAKVLLKFLGQLKKC